MTRLTRYTECAVCKRPLQIDPHDEAVWSKGIAYCVDCSALPMQQQQEAPAP